MKSNYAFKPKNDAWFEFVDAFPGLAHIKDGTTRSYLHINPNVLPCFGASSPQEIIGLTIDDLDQTMKPYWVAGFATQVTELDKETVATRAAISNRTQLLIDKNNRLHLLNTTKVPIVSDVSRRVLILTVSIDVTKNMSVFFILKQYMEIHPAKKKACIATMNHLGIIKFFKEILSVKELFCLFHMMENRSYKFLAQQMHISVKTVQSHINHIVEKSVFHTIAQVLENVTHKKIYDYSD